VKIQGGEKICSRCVTTVQGFNLLQRKKNSHKSEVIVQYTPKTFNRTQQNKEDGERYQYLNAEQQENGVSVKW
jgi:hypothetical protein